MERPQSAARRSDRRAVCDGRRKDSQIGAPGFFNFDCGVDQLVDQQTHNLQVAGSSPAPAISTPDKNPHTMGFSYTPIGAGSPAPIGCALRTQSRRTRAISPALLWPVGKDFSPRIATDDTDRKWIDQRHRRSSVANTSLEPSMFSNPKLLLGLIIFAVALALTLIFGEQTVASALTSSLTVATAITAAISALESAGKADDAAVDADGSATRAKEHLAEIRSRQSQQKASGNSSTSTPSLNSLALLLLPLLCLGAIVSVGGCASIDPTINTVYPPTTQGSNERAADQLEAAYDDAVLATEFSYGLGAITPEQFAAAQLIEHSIKPLIDRARDAAYAGRDDAQTILNEAAQALVNFRNQRQAMKAVTLKAKFGK
jgi:hypothetical protein